MPAQAHAVHDIPYHTALQLLLLQGALDCRMHQVLHCFLCCLECFSVVNPSLVHV